MRKIIQNLSLLALLLVPLKVLAIWSNDTIIDGITYSGWGDDFSWSCEDTVNAVNNIIFIDSDRHPISIGQLFDGCSPKCARECISGHVTFLDTIISNMALIDNYYCEEAAKYRKKFVVANISYNAFYGCKLITSMTLPQSLKEIEWGAFYNCTNLSSITIKATTPPSVGTDAFYGVPKNIPVYVPCESVDAYKRADGWKDFTNIQAIMPYNVQVNALDENGSVAIRNSSSKCNFSSQLTATPNTGYHFVKWSDGDINNPRTVQLTQDTTFTAEFAKNSYTITATSNNAEYGIATGGKKAEYLDTIVLTATEQIGHHFEYWQVGSTKYIDNPLQVIVKGDETYTAYFTPNIYSLTVNANSSQGYVTAPTQAAFLEMVSMAATPLKGYEFIKWSDGNVDNPRYVQLTQDTSFTAEFAKAIYTISTAVNDAQYGTTIGDNTAEYLQSLTLTATENYGYHFGHWECDGKRFTTNPLSITVTESATYTAYFEKNTYYIDAISSASTLGDVTAPSHAQYLDEVKLTATPKEGCRFVKWRDGNTDNPRYFVLTHDTVFFAEFEIITSGYCGANLQWRYNNNTLTFFGSGAMTDYSSSNTPWFLLNSDIKTVILPEGLTSIGAKAFDKCTNLTTIEWNPANCSASSSASEAPFYAIRTNISSFIFGEKVKKIPAYLCYEMENLSSLTLGSNVTTIGKHAFEGCTDLASITCEAITPPNCQEEAFAGVSIFTPIYVPISAIEKYAKAPIWKDFDTFSSIQAEKAAITEVNAKPQENSVVLEWPENKDADVYTIVVERGGVTFCSLSFNGLGQLLGIQFAPGRNGQPQATFATKTAAGWQFTITSLEAGTTYDYTVTATKEDNTPVYTKSGSFTTTGSATGIDDVQSDNVQSTKIIRNGQILVLRGEKTYTLTGQEVR